MFWNRHKIGRLKEQAAQAEARIRDLFLSGAITLGESHYAWGQFLDEPRDNTQYGIYGTSAAVQVLTAAGISPDDVVITGACSILGNALENKEDNNIFCEKGDLFVLYKLAYLAEAALPGEDDMETSCQPMDEIIRRVLPERGWGEYYQSDSDRDIHPRIVATAAALLSLQRYRPFRSRRECEDSLRWLCRTVMENGTLRPHEFALTGLALMAYKTPGISLPNYESAINSCKANLIRWAKPRKTRQLGTSEVHYYSTRLQGRRINRYLFFLPDTLAALVFLRLNSPKSIRRFVIRVVQYYVTEIRSKNGFAPNTTKRLSTVDHLWIYRLLNEFRFKPLNSLVPSSYLLLSAASPLIRVTYTLFWFIVGCFGLYLINSKTSDILLRTGGGVLSTVGMGLFVRLLWDWWRGEESW